MANIGVTMSLALVTGGKLFYFLASLVVFGLIILFHEGGHFLVAKLKKVRVEEFAVGFGPPLYQKKVGETLYSIRLIPLGGYVKLTGEDEEPADPLDSSNFQNKSFLDRMAIVVAGPLMNYILAFLFLWFSAITFGIPAGDKFSTTLGEILPGSQAQLAGLKEKDQVLAIWCFHKQQHGKELESNEGMEMKKIISTHAGEKLRLIVKRGNEIKEFLATPTGEIGSKDGKLGFMMVPVYKKVNPFVAIYESALDVYIFNKQMIMGLYYVITKKIKSGVSGPVGIVSMMIHQGAQYGFFYFLNLAAIINVCVGFFNLLPIPALDGMRLVFLFIGSLRGRSISQKKEGFVHYIGFILLILLILVVTYQDILRIVRGDNLIK